MNYFCNLEARPLRKWTQALRAVRGWLEPWIMLRRYWSGWSSLPPPPAMQLLLRWLERGHAISLYSSARPKSTKYRYMLPGKLCVVMVQWGKVCGRAKRRKKLVTAPLTLPALDAATLTKLRHRYEETPKVETRTRYQMLLLAIAMAMNVVQLTSWLRGEAPEQTRTSPFKQEFNIDELYLLYQNIRFFIYLTNIK